MRVLAGLLLAAAAVEASNSTATTAAASSGNSTSSSGTSGGSATTASGTSSSGGSATTAASSSSGSSATTAASGSSSSGSSATTAAASSGNTTAATGATEDQEITSNFGFSVSSNVTGSCGGSLMFANVQMYAITCAQLASLEGTDGTSCTLKACTGGKPASGSEYCMTRTAGTNKDLNACLTFDSTTTYFKKSSRRSLEASSRRLATAVEVGSTEKYTVLTASKSAFTTKSALYTSKSDADLAALVKKGADVVFNGGSATVGGVDLSNGQTLPTGFYTEAAAVAAPSVQAKGSIAAASSSSSTSGAVATFLSATALVGAALMF